MLFIIGNLQVIIKSFWWWVKKKTSEKVARAEFFGWIFGRKRGAGQSNVQVFGG